MTRARTTDANRATLALARLVLSVTFSEKIKGSEGKRSRVHGWCPSNIKRKIPFGWTAKRNLDTKIIVSHQRKTNNYESFENYDTLACRTLSHFVLPKDDGYSVVCNR